MIETTAAYASLLGLAIAIFQIWRTGRVVLATRRATEYTTSRLAEYAVLAQYSELLELQAELDRAVANDEPQAARVALLQWDRRAFELVGMRVVTSIPSDDVRRAALSAREAAEKIKRRHKATLATITASAEGHIGTVCSIVRQANGELRVKPPLDLTVPDRGAREDLRELYWPMKIKIGGGGRGR
ncbi:hypothetical protein RN607_08210 [Demequina capsici]|uniref:Uncharacterized protein n=1 Tax=Demequina capsici TaxID=3075620 RepID=A0AA96FA64_9MICO|nr:hypothetical protein [Demequina sp. PMTSA13]WNM26182.1 hypothetical protein RN607_08210 [Demequina sp. PMTSA13]